jgi:hypothetical protein
VPSASAAEEKVVKVIVSRSHGLRKYGMSDLLGIRDLKFITSRANFEDL